MDRHLLRCHVLGNQFRRETSNCVLFGNYRLRIVLRFVTWSTRRAGNNELALSRNRPVGRALTRYFAVCNKTLRVRDLVPFRLSDDEVRVKGRQILLLVLWLAASSRSGSHSGSCPG